MDLPEWALKAGTAEAECGADEARSQFDSWKTLLDEGLFDHPKLFYDEGPGFFRFSDGAFALARPRELSGAQEGRLLPRVGDVSSRTAPARRRGCRREAGPGPDRRKGVSVAVGIILVLAMVFAAAPTALAAAVFGLLLQSRASGRPIVVLIATLFVAVVAYVASVALLFVGIITLGNAT